MNPYFLEFFPGFGDEGIKNQIGTAAVHKYRAVYNNFSVCQFPAAVGRDRFHVLTMAGAAAFSILLHLNAFYAVAFERRNLERQSALKTQSASRRFSLSHDAVRPIWIELIRREYDRARLRIAVVINTDDESFIG